MVTRQITVPYSRGYDYGIGADLASGSPMNRVIKNEISGVEGGTGATVSFRVERIQTTEELERSLGIDVEANYGAAAFGAGASARFSFAKKQKVQSTSLFMTAVAQVELGFVSIDDARLTPEAEAIVGQADVFASRFGNMFVRGIGRGGLFVGVFRMETSSSEQSQDISGEIGGSYGLFSAEAKTKFQEIQKKHQIEINVDMYHEGGPTNLKITDMRDPLQILDQMNAFLDSFHTQPDAVAVPYFVTLAPITIAHGPLPPNAAELQHAQDVLAACAKARSRLIDKINLLEYIMDNVGRYDFPVGVDQNAIRAAMQDYQADLDLVADCASTAIRSPAKASMPAVFAQSVGTTYPKGVLPQQMPLPKAAAMVAMPDFSACRWWSECEGVAAAAGLVAQQIIAAMPEADKFTILSVSPPPGTSVPTGSAVTIVTQPTKIFRLFPGGILSKLGEPSLRDAVTFQGIFQ